jgi:hypothetical protein
MFEPSLTVLVRRSHGSRLFRGFSHDANIHARRRAAPGFHQLHEKKPIVSRCWCDGSLCDPFIGWFEARKWQVRGP